MDTIKMTLPSNLKKGSLLEFRALKNGDKAPLQVYDNNSGTFIGYVPAFYVNENTLNIDKKYVDMMFE
jgi:hypothetical protein